MRSFALIPAAGKSRRMGRPKLLLPWGEGRVIDAVLRAWRESGITACAAVVRRDDEELAEACRAGGAAVVQPPVDPPEMKDSLLAGLRWLAQEWAPCAGADVWLTAPADLPGLSSDVIRELLAAHDPTAPAILRPVHAGRAGHPVLFPWRGPEELEALLPDGSLRTLIERGPSRLVPVAAPLSHDDLDEPDDYRRLRGEA